MRWNACKAPKKGPAAKLSKSWDARQRLGHEPATKRGRARGWDHGFLSGTNGNPEQTGKSPTDPGTTLRSWQPWLAIAWRRQKPGGAGHVGELFGSQQRERFSDHGYPPGKTAFPLPRASDLLEKNLLGSGGERDGDPSGDGKHLRIRKRAGQRQGREQRAQALKHRRGRGNGWVCR